MYQFLGTEIIWFYSEKYMGTFENIVWSKWLPMHYDNLHLFLLDIWVFQGWLFFAVDFLKGKLACALCKCQIIKAGVFTCS